MPKRTLKLGNTLVYALSSVLPLPVPVLNACSAGVSQHWMSVAWFAPLLAGSQAPWPRGQRVGVPLRGREADLAMARHFGAHEAHADVADHVHAAEIRLGSAEAQHEVGGLALLLHVEDFGLREAALARHVGGAIAQRIPALRRVDIAIRETFGVQIVVAQRGAVQEHQRTVGNTLPS